MAISPRPLVSALQTTELLSPSALVRTIEVLLLDVSVSHNFIRLADFRKNIRILSTLLPPIEKTLEGETISRHHQTYLYSQLNDVQQHLYKILHSLHYYRLVLYWTPLDLLWRCVYLNSPQGQLALNDLRKLAFRVIALDRSEPVKAMKRAASLDILVEATSSASATQSTRAVAGPGLHPLQPPAPFKCDTPRVIKLSQISERDRVYLVVGATGSGKSTFINTAVGKQLAGVSDSLEPCTQQVQAYRYTDTRHCRVVFIDTPGFDDIHDADILASISEWLNPMYERDISPSGVLYLHDLSINRVNGSPSKNMMLVSKMCGSNSRNSIAVVPTMGQDLEASARASRLASVTKYWQSVIPNESAIMPFDGTQASAPEIVDRLNGSQPLLISVEMHGKKSLIDTSVGKFLLNWLQSMFRRIKKQLAQFASQRWTSSATGEEEALRAYLKAIACQIEVLFSSGGKKANKSKGKAVVTEPFDPVYMDSIHAASHRLILISQLTTELQHLSDVEQQVPTPCIGSGLRVAQEVLRTMQNSEGLRISIARLLQDLSIFFSVALDVTIQGDSGHGPLHPVLVHVSSVLESSKECIKQIASSTEATSIAAYSQLSSCRRTVNDAYNILEQIHIRLHSSIPV